VAEGFAALKRELSSRFDSVDQARLAVFSREPDQNGSAWLPHPSGVGSADLDN
jgi:hypothetical protein